MCIAAERPELESPATTYTVNARRQQRAQGPAPSNPFGADDLVSRPVINTASPQFFFPEFSGFFDVAKDPGSNATKCRAKRN